MRMKDRVKWLIIMGMGVLLLSGCAESSEQPADETETETANENYVEKETATLEDYHLRDKVSVYEEDEEGSIVTMYLTVREGNSAENTNHTWTEVNTYSKYWYEENNIPQYAVEGILQIGDENGPQVGEVGYGETVPNAIIKIRGQTSTRREQKNYKIELKDGKGEWRGQQTINLNKHVNEGLRFRNKLAYDLMKEIPQMMSARTQFVHLYVKDETAGGSGVFEDYGLFTQVEQINKTYLRTHGLDNNGQLYKIEFFEFQRYEDAIKLSTDPSYDLEIFEDYLEVKGDEDHSKLIAMLQDVNDYSIPIEQTVEKWFDTENLFYWMGFHILTGNNDTNSRNYFLYSPLNVNKFYILSWDNDGSFHSMEDQVSGKIGEEDSWEHGLSNYWGNILYQRMFKVKEYRDELTAAIEDLRSQYLTEEKINSLVSTYRIVTKPYVYRMPDLMYAPLTESEYDVVADSIAKEVEENYQLYLESLEKPMPFYIGVPEASGDKLTFVWDTAYDFDGENITYSIDVSSDYLFQNIIYSSTDLRIPEMETNILPPGQYFVRVIAENESGKTQTAFDYYSIDEGKVYGTKCFYILEDGSIEEDIRVE